MPNNVIVKDLQFFPGITDHDDTAGVIAVTAANGDRVNLVLTPAQVDEAASELLALACDLLAVE